MTIRHKHGYWASLVCLALLIIFDFTGHVDAAVVMLVTQIACMYFGATGEMCYWQRKVYETRDYARRYCMMYSDARILASSHGASVGPFPRDYLSPPEVE